MPRASTDANLLMGVTAVQMNFVKQSSLIEAMREWTRDKSQSLGEVLLKRQAITEKQLKMLDDLVNEHLAGNDDSAAESLSELKPDATLVDSLRSLADSDIDDSLTHISSQPGGSASDTVNDAFSTQVTPPVGDPDRTYATPPVDQPHAAPAAPDETQRVDPSAATVNENSDDGDGSQTLQTPPVGDGQALQATRPTHSDSTHVDIDEKADQGNKPRAADTLVDAHATQVTPPVDEQHGTIATPPVDDQFSTQVTPPGYRSGDTELSTGSQRGAGQGGGSAFIGGDSVMRYRRMRFHAKGGLGQVSVAMDEELKREVALKELQSRHADHRDSRERFLLEAEITGCLEHPGIVPVYGLGQYPDGRPYYAMRFVRGDDLKQAIDRFHEADKAGREPGERELQLRKLLGRFIDVCHAIQYAHSRGVLHRDLKPANVMLGSFGETLVVDWGLAKSLDGDDLDEKSKESWLQPSYISGGSQTQMGSIVGTPGYMSPEQARGRLDLLEPASDIYSLGATLFYLLVGKAPFTDRDISALLKKVERGEFRKPREVNDKVPPALEAICVKAMANNPADRYASAADLAEDIENWLADEPVSAWPEPWHVAAMRWIRRHKTLVTGVAASVVVTTVAFIIIAIVLGVKNDQLAVANANEKKQRGIAEEQRDRAEDNFEMARDAVEQFFTLVSEDVLLDQPGMQPLREKLLSRARDYHQNFIAQAGDDPDVREDVAMSHFYLGRITEIIGTAEKSLEAYAAAEMIQQGLVDAESDDERLARLGTTLNAMGRVHHNKDDYTNAEKRYKQALEVRKKLSKKPEFQRMLANTYMNLGDITKKQAAAAGIDDDQRTKLFDDARDYFKQGQDIRNSVPEDDRTEALRRDIGKGHYNAAVLERDAKKVDEAIAHAKAAIKVFEQLQEDESEELDNVRQLAVSYRFHGDLIVSQAKTAEAIDLYKKAEKVLEPLVLRNPNVHDYVMRLAEIRNLLAGFQLQSGDKDAAAKTIDKSIEAIEPLVALYDEPAYKYNHAAAYYVKAMIAMGSAPEDAIAASQECIEILTPIKEKFPQAPALLSAAEALIKQLKQPAPKTKTG